MASRLTDREGGRERERERERKSGGVVGVEGERRELIEAGRGCRAERIRRTH